MSGAFVGILDDRFEPDATDAAKLTNVGSRERCTSKNAEWADGEKDIFGLNAQLSRRTPGVTPRVFLKTVVMCAWLEKPHA